MEKAIKDNYAKLPYASQGLLDAHLRKLDGLLVAHLGLLQLKERYVQFARRTGERDIVDAITGLQNEMQSDPPRVAAIKQRRLTILEKRLGRFKKAGENLAIIEAQLETIEDVARYVYEQSLTMQNPDEVSFQLDTLMNEVEETQQSMEALDTAVGTGSLTEGRPRRLRRLAGRRPGPDRRRPPRLRRARRPRRRARPGHRRRRPPPPARGLTPLATPTAGAETPSPQTPSRPVSDFQTIQTETDADGVLTITLDRPDALNALSQQLVAELSKAMRLARRDDVKGVVITGAGEKAFAAGADISEFAGMEPLDAHRFAARGQAVFTAIENTPKPVVAAVNGFALGGGCELAMACHLRVAAETGAVRAARGPARAHRRVRRDPATAPAGRARGGGGDAADRRARLGPAGLRGRPG